MLSTMQRDIPDAQMRIPWLELPRLNISNATENNSINLPQSLILLNENRRLTLQTTTRADSPPSSSSSSPTGNLIMDSSWPQPSPTTSSASSFSPMALSPTSSLTPSPTWPNIQPRLPQSPFSSSSPTDQTSAFMQIQPAAPFSAIQQRSHSEIRFVTNYDSPRKRPTPAQTAELWKAFRADPFPTVSAREQLASRIGMNPKPVQVWFQNRRQALRLRARELSNKSPLSGSPPPSSSSSSSSSAVTPQSFAFDPSVSSPSSAKQEATKKSPIQRKVDSPDSGPNPRPTNASTSSMETTTASAFSSASETNEQSALVKNGHLRPW